MRKLFSFPTVACVENKFWGFAMHIIFCFAHRELDLKRLDFFRVRFALAALTLVQKANDFRFRTHHYCISVRLGKS